MCGYLTVTVCKYKLSFAFRRIFRKKIAIFNFN
uniref:Uncharacterized protein n=1 Tax=Siphoviridae sp. ctOiG6 TaxID=2826313 RepID=A0A8S5N1M9_9CAUD|nr:MAG TPA: hypothetical protein [Siphoviridae sp. ctOiG6]